MPLQRSRGAPFPIVLLSYIALALLSATVELRSVDIFVSWGVRVTDTVTTTVVLGSAAQSSIDTFVTVFAATCLVIALTLGAYVGRRIWTVR